MSIIVTGGAGFIGSCVVRTLNDMGINDIIIVDNIACTDKWLNLRNKNYSRYVNKNIFLDELDREKHVSAIIHMGACSSTTEKNFDYLWKNNFEYSKVLWDYCIRNKCQFIYASSAATYGDGSLGFNDEMDIDQLLPLNGYGYSKQIFDMWVKKQSLLPKQYVGLKFFNVYGPNEYNKGNMASMIYHGYNQIKEKKYINLFKSYNYDYCDGGQLRDFIYVKDVCDIIKFFLEHPDKNGIFNVGTGKARSFFELALAAFQALKVESQIHFIEMPEYLKDKYQYYTKAQITKLRSVGYNKEFMSLEEGANDYICNYLEKEYRVY